MSGSVTMLVEPFVRRGLFETPERAVRQMAREFVLHQIETDQSEIAALEAKYGMSYERFEAYLQARSKTLAAEPNRTLNQAIMLEEEDAFTWKSSLEMLESWLGLQAEVGA